MDVLYITLLVAGCLLLSALALATVVMVVPFGFEASGRLADTGREGIRLSASFRAWWGAGLLVLRREPGGKPELLVLGWCVWRLEEWKPLFSRLRTWNKKRRAKKKKKKKKRMGAKQSLRLVVTLGKIILRMLRTVRLDMRVEGIVGLGDPADTWFFFEAVRLVRLLLPPMDLRLRSDYVDEALELDAKIGGRGRLAHMAAVLVSALFERETRRALLAAR